MKAIFIAVILLIALHSNAQDTTATFTNTKCFYKTDGSSQSSDLKIQLEHPCEWLPYNNKNVVQGFHFHAGEGMEYLQYLQIEKLPKKYQKEADTLFIEEGLKNLASESGYFFISGKEIKIDTFKAAEIIYKTTYKNHGHNHFVHKAQFFFRYGKYLILLTLSAEAHKETEAAQMFSKHLAFFQELGTSMILFPK